MSNSHLGSCIRLPPPPPFLQSCPSASMGAHGRLALPHENPTIHDLLVDRLRVSLPSSAAHPRARGVLLGVCAELGISMPRGIEYRPAPESSTARLPTLWNSLRHGLLAREQRCRLHCVVQRSRLASATPSRLATQGTSASAGPLGKAELIRSCPHGRDRRRLVQQR